MLFPDVFEPIDKEPKDEFDNDEEYEEWSLPVGDHAVGQKQAFIETGILFPMYLTLFNGQVFQQALGAIITMTLSLNVNMVSFTIGIQ